jgi:hypothetical protein
MSNILIKAPGSIIAILLVVVTFLLPLFSRELRKSESIYLGYWFVIILHHIVAFLNVYLFATIQRGTIGATNDANMGFHLIAKELASLGDITYRAQKLSVPLSLDSFFKGGAFYYEMLGSVYKWFGASHLLGEQLSILVFALSCIVFLKIIRQLGLEHYSFLLLIFFGGLPSMVFLGSITLRESYELFFFMLAVYIGVNVLTKKKINIGPIFLMAVSALLMGVFHKVLIIYSFFLIFIFLVWNLRPISRFGNIKKLHLMAMLIIPLLVLTIIVLTEKKLAYFDLINVSPDIFIQHVIGWREAPMALKGRTSYNIPIDSSTSLTLILSGLKIYGYYLFAGFTWSMDYIVDVYATGESILRMTLIFFALLGWWKAVGSQKRLMGLMLVLYISMTFLWAVGTTNFGTAIRHHMLTWWIIVILGVPQLFTKLHFFWGKLLRYPASSANKWHG